jgi:hypothetical protein
MLAARIEPILRNTYGRFVQQLARLQQQARHLAEEQAPRLRALQEFTQRLVRRWRGEIAGLTAQLSRRLRGG